MSNEERNTFIGGAATPKMWKDLTVEEKIERTRMEIKNLSSRIGNFNYNTTRLREEFLAHDHKDGKVMKPAKENDSMGLASALRPDPKAEAEGNVYF